MKTPYYSTLHKCKRHPSLLEQESYTSPVLLEAYRLFLSSLKMQIIIAGHNALGWEV